MSHATAGDRTTAPANRLARESSPYLLQHARNPVDWYPWGEEAFERARADDRPIFLSIGYATCHWCHVMERESFEDQEVAGLLNETFVCIKVDREERPDIDQVYMTVCQMLTGSGGWPLTIIMTPDRKPFFAATYIPRQSVYGRVGMLDLLPRVRDAWRSDRPQLVRSSEEIVGHLKRVAGGASGGSVDIDLVENAYRQLANRFDEERGGFGTAPKFPAPHHLIFLTRHWRHSGTGPALEMVAKTLTEMRRGGVWDHVGHGFHRYSTDRDWLLPHFEKMLYDQAMQGLAYTEAYRATEDPTYAQVVREISTYVLRDMTSPEGGFYSAEDADSEGEEGKFYVWKMDEVRQVLGDADAAFAARVWSLAEAGNFHDEASGGKTGANIPHLGGSLDALAQLLGLAPESLASRLETVREKLFVSRETRIHPLKDDKVLADWNGLMVAAMARAGTVLEEPTYVTAASRAADFVLEHMRDSRGRLVHRFRAGKASIPAFLDDYVFLTWGLLELYDATLDPTRLAQALALQQETLDRFWDSSSGGFFFTADDAEELLVRQKEIYDGAIPSGNSVAVDNLIRLSRLTGRVDLARRADELVHAFALELARLPSAHTHLISALQRANAPSLEVVIAGEPGAQDTESLIAAVRSADPLDAALLLVPDGEQGKAVRELAPFAVSYRPVDGKAAAYVCRDFSCQLPTTEPEELRRMLESHSPGS